MLRTPETRPMRRSALTGLRGARIPSPRILLYAGAPGLRVERSLALAAALAGEFARGRVVLATGAPGAGRSPAPARVDVVRMPALVAEAPARPLARARTRRLRERLLATLFDVFLPDLVLLAGSGTEAAAGAEAEETAEEETQLLLLRARTFGTAARSCPAHAEPAEACASSETGPTAHACEPCRRLVCSAARAALAQV